MEKTIRTSKIRFTKIKIITMENCIGKTGLITDKKSLFKGQNCTVVKEQKRWYVCEVEENGKPKNVYVSRGGIKFEGAKMKDGGGVVENKQTKGYLKAKAMWETMRDYEKLRFLKYLKVPEVYAKKDFEELHKKAKVGLQMAVKSYPQGVLRGTPVGRLFVIQEKDSKKAIEHPYFVIDYNNKVLYNAESKKDATDWAYLWEDSEDVYSKGGNVDGNAAEKTWNEMNFGARLLFMEDNFPERKFDTNEVVKKHLEKIKYKNLSEKYKKVVDEKFGNKMAKGGEINNYKEVGRFEKVEKIKIGDYVTLNDNQLGGFKVRHIKKTGNMITVLSEDKKELIKRNIGGLMYVHLPKNNSKTKAKLLIINSANPLSKQLIAEGFEQFNAIDYTEVKHANFNVLTHNESKKTFVVYPERIYSQLDEETLQSDIDYMKGKGIELVESFEQGGNIDSEQKHEYMMLSRLQSDCEYFLNHGGRSERVLWAGNVVDQIKEMKSLYNKLTIKPEWISMEDILEYEKKMKESYEKGGNIPNSYEGKTAEQVWDSWDAKQRYHFLSDHAAFIEEIKGLEEIESSELRKTRNADWKKLEKDIKLLISNHVSEGQYAKGGNLTNEKIFEVKYHTREQLKKKGKMRGSMTAIIKASNREDAIAKVKKENKDFQQLVNCKATKMNVDFFEEGGGVEKNILKQYKDNEAINAHSENILLLAENFGTKEDLQNAKRMVERANKLGYTPSDLNAEMYELHKKLYTKLIATKKTNTKEKDEFVSEGKDKKGNTAIVYYNNESKKYYFTVNGRDLYNVEFETKDAAIKHLIGKGFEMQFYSDKRSVLQIEREIKELENEMEKNKNDYEAAVARIEKIKGDKLVELSEIKSVSSEGAKPQQGWLVGLNEEQIEFLCGLINRYGTVSEHPKATKENLGSFKYEYLKNLISNVNQNEIEEGGMSVLNGLKTHFNI